MKKNKIIKKLSEIKININFFLPNNIIRESIAIFIFVLIIGLYNKSIAYFTIVCYIYSLLLYSTKDGKYKIIITSCLCIFGLIILYKILNYNEQAKEFFNKLLKKDTWMVWLGCITVNSYVFSKMCNNKDFKGRISYAMCYLLVLIIGVLFSITIEMVYAKSYMDDNNIIINKIYFYFVILYSVLDVIIPTIDECIMLLNWKYELNDNMIILVKYKGKKKSVHVNNIYNIRGKEYSTYVGVGAFSNAKVIETVDFQQNVKFHAQTLSTLFDKSFGIREIYGLKNIIVYDRKILKLYFNNLKTIEYVYK